MQNSLTKFSRTRMDSKVLVEHLPTCSTWLTVLSGDSIKWTVTFGRMINQVQYGSGDVLLECMVYTCLTVLRKESIAAFQPEQIWESEPIQVTYQQHCRGHFPYRSVWNHSVFRYCADEDTESGWKSLTIMPVFSTNGKSSLSIWIGINDANQSQTSLYYM